MKTILLLLMLPWLACAQPFSFGSNWWENNGINGGNPLLYDMPIGRYEPVVGSFLIDAGTNLSAYFTKDYIGTARSGWSIGPYELGVSLLSAMITNFTVGTLIILGQ